MNKLLVFLGFVLFLSGCSSLQNANEASGLEAGRAVSYSTLYDTAITTHFFRDLTYTSANSDLSFHYALSNQKNYLFSKDGVVVLLLPLDRALHVGDQWQKGLVSFEVLEKTEDGYLVSSNFLGESQCFDGWKAGKTRILFSFKHGLVNTSAEQLECANSNLKGFTVTDYSGRMWAVEIP